MKIFTFLYRKVLFWASQDGADKYLYGISFAEAVIFPIPPDVLLIPMCAARPNDALRLGLMTTLFSVLGGMLGYVLGFFVLDFVEPWIMASDWSDNYLGAQQLFDKWGIIIVIVSGFSPIPYKIFTFAAGALQLAFPLFIVASFIGRGGRFLLIAMLLKYIGPAVLPKIERIIEQLGWLLVFAFMLFLIVYYLGVV